MAAVGPLMVGKLPPVGQPVSTARSDKSLPTLAGYQTHWLGSGTAALAMALQAARMRRRDVSRPKVFVPAYGCCDLVAAAVFAGVEPILIDIGEDDPGFNLDALRARHDSSVIAIVAVNFLGIRERMTQLRAFAGTHGIFLIEDAAQGYPEPATQLCADAVVLSFGRGKPVNLLGGGALLLRNECATGHALQPEPAERSYVPFAAQAFVFNSLMHRLPYAVVSRVPSLELGVTRYIPLDAISSMSLAQMAHLSANVSHWVARDRWRERVLSERLERIDGVQALPVSLQDRAGRLLRYPVLFQSKQQRDLALEQLDEMGLGASPMYRVPLPEIESVPEQIRCQSGFCGARAFAARLVTLPIHDGVRRSDIDRICTLIERLPK